MRLDAGAQGNGKTSRALLWLSEDPDNRAVLVATHYEAQNLIQAARRKYPGLRFDELNIIPVTNPTGLKELKREILVDNADRVINQLLEIKIAALTVTGEQIPPYMIVEEIELELEFL